MNTLSQTLDTLPGIGAARVKLFQKLGIETIGDMLGFYPRYVEDRSLFVPIRDLQGGQTAAVRATVASPVSCKRIRPNFTVYSFVIKDDYHVATVAFYNNRFVQDVFKIGQTYDFYGKVSLKYGRVELIGPTYETAHKNMHTGRIVPIYPLTENLPQKVVRRAMQACVDRAADKVAEILPAEVLRGLDLIGIYDALREIHFPESMDQYERARTRLAFEELLVMQMGIVRMRQSIKSRRCKQMDILPWQDRFIGQIPFKLTDAQLRVIGEIYSDMAGNTPMSRLVQGDVGCGKTVVAFAAIFGAVQCDRQAVMMAPTEVLAMQHYHSAMQFFDPDTVVLLTGSVTAKEKKMIKEKIKQGQISLVIGTHAVIQDNVEFADLGLVVTDEQHRFGVNQRAALAQKGENPHMLVMSATPIPRSLALILYGDLEISIIDQMPPGRVAVETYVVDENMRGRIYAFVRKHIEVGRQVYIVCPLVSELEKMDLKAAEQLYESLKQDVFPDYSVALLYGKMKNADKNRIMAEFARGTHQILVSTTVIEVGVNVPNATVMVIENAERFGLSQLHQIRGRVGRGSDQSYCILFAQGGGEKTKERLQVLEQTNDGFEIAKKDLQLRGAGDILGTRQHGLPQLKIADVFDDLDLSRSARDWAQTILAQDLDRTRWPLLWRRVDAVFSQQTDSGIIS